MFVKLTKTLVLLLSVNFIVACSDSNFSGKSSVDRPSAIIPDDRALDTPSDTEDEQVKPDDVPKSFDKAPTTYAFGGELQLHFANTSSEFRVGVEGLIGQSLKHHSTSQNGVRIDVGYSHLQAQFGL